MTKHNLLSTLASPFSESIRSGKHTHQAVALQAPRRASIYATARNARRLTSLPALAALANCQPSKEALMRRIMRRNLNGARGLITAVIAQAVNDWRSGTRRRRKNARKYFGGPVYKYHLTLLDLPKDWLPTGVELEH